jgi:D-3-phosphoglycerate dehydrogenase/(S)-sulfolactate dehydrogenase
MRNKILITEFMEDERFSDLEEYGEVVYDPDLWEKDQLTNEIQETTVLIVRNKTMVDSSLLNKAKKLKIIGRLGVGLDNIDVQSAKSHDIRVIYARNANAISVAEYVLGVMMQFSRDFYGATRDIKNGNWDRQKYTLYELYGKTLGLIGVGEIGSRLALRAQSLGMKLLGYDPYIPPYETAIMDLGVRICSFNEIIKESDFISIHVPLNKSTKNMIDDDVFGEMKKSSYIINTSRGGIIDENALYRALKSNKISGAALDVFSSEPPVESSLLQLDNVILTPHIAGVTCESQIRTSDIIIDEVLKVMQGQVSLCTV